MAKITFKNGYEIDAEQNGNCYITVTKPDFPDDLSRVIIKSYGEVTKLKNAQLVECASVDSRYWFTFLGEQYYNDPTLDEVKTEKIAELKVIRDAKEVEPVQTSKGLFDYDDKSRDRLSIARQSLADNPSVESIVWTTADNQRVAMTIDDFAEINSMAAYRSNQLHVKYNDLKAEVNACETVEEVEAIHWPEE